MCCWWAIGLALNCLIVLLVTILTTCRAWLVVLLVLLLVWPVLLLLNVSAVQLVHYIETLVHLSVQSGIMQAKSIKSEFVWHAILVVYNALQLPIIVSYVRRLSYCKQPVVSVNVLQTTISQHHLHNVWSVCHRVVLAHLFRDVWVV